MKKLTVLLAMTMLLAACGGNSEPEKKGNGESAKDKNGDYATAEITVRGKIQKRAWRQIWNEGRKQESEKGMG